MEQFQWQDYLDAHKLLEVPQTCFQHVEVSIENEIRMGMCLEVPVNKKESQEPVYWVASIVVVCGPLLRLKYFGSQDKSLEFWFDLSSQTAHELGWCVKNDKRLEPPDAVLEKSPNCSEQLPEFLTTAKSIPSEMLSGNQLTIVDRIKEGMKVEVSDVIHPYKVWVTTIIENVGGRLLLQYDIPGSSIKVFWAFFTSEQLHRYGFVSKMNSKWFFEPASSIVDLHSYEEWKDLIENIPKNLKVPDNLFNNYIEHPKHDFKLNMKLEAVSPYDRTKICPASVVKVFDDTYFLVSIDAYNPIPELISDECNECNEENTWLCTKDHPYIFPLRWAQDNELCVTPPKNWNSPFDWDEYLKATGASGANRSLFSPRKSAIDAGFKCNMMLETVDPVNDNLICAARITKIKSNLLWLKLVCYGDDHPDVITSMDSLDIFPVGWCESNRYPLKPPKNYIELYKKKQVTPIINCLPSENNKSLWCPKIYFNYQCFTGPMISKGKLATLPKYVGPGSVFLVMREVIAMIISVGYRSTRVLKVLQSDPNKFTKPGYQNECMKAKYDNKYVYRANVAIITSADLIEEFCKDICRKLQVCPNLFGPVLLSKDDCPENCNKRAKKSVSAVKSGRKRKLKGKPSIMVGKQKTYEKKKKEQDKVKSDKDSNEAEQAETPSPSIENQQNNHSDSDLMEKSCSVKQEVLTSNDDSRSSSDRKSKESNDSPNSSNGDKMQLIKSKRNVTLTRSKKRKREDYDTSIESDGSINLAAEESPKVQKKQRRPKTKTLDSNPLHWSVDDVFRYLCKTPDCRKIAHLIRQEEIDGLAFLLLNLPSVIAHLNLKKSAAEMLCRHVEQVKVTYFLKHLDKEDDKSE